MTICTALLLSGTLRKNQIPGHINIQGLRKEPSSPTAHSKTTMTFIPALIIKGQANKSLPITRSVVVSYLSRFLPLLAANMTVSQVVYAPGLAHLLAINILYRDQFIASGQLVPRHCASAVNKITIP